MILWIKYSKILFLVSRQTSCEYANEVLEIEFLVATSYIEQILKATSHKRAAVRPLTTHL